MRQTWILLTISIIFMIGHYNHILLFEMYDIDALVWQENLFFRPFSLESKFFHQMRQTWILITISIIFMIGHYNDVLLIEIHDIEALVW